VISVADRWGVPACLQLDKKSARIQKPGRFLIIDKF
jgi:hypothetical protein